MSKPTLAPDSKSLPVHIEKELAIPNWPRSTPPATSSSTGKEAPSLEGITNDSAAVVVATDATTNQLTVRTSNGDDVIYSPHLTKAMTAQSKVYREEHQEFAQGDRIRLTETDASQGTRKGDFGTVAAIGNKLKMRLDKGGSVQLNQEQARYIEHVYAVDSLKTDAPERVLISQEDHSRPLPRPLPSPAQADR